jgi:hypothetical protein
VAKPVKLHRVYGQAWRKLGGVISLPAGDTEYYSKTVNVVGKDAISVYCKYTKASDATRIKIKPVYHIDPEATAGTWHTSLTQVADASGKAVLGVPDEYQVTVPAAAGTYYWSLVFHPGKRYFYAQFSTENNSAAGTDTVEWYWQTSASGLPGDDPWRFRGPGGGGGDDPPGTGDGDGGLDGGDIDG